MYIQRPVATVFFPSVWLMVSMKHFVTKCFTAPPFSPLHTPQSFFSPVIRCFSGAADSFWSLSRWVRCVQVTRHLTLRGFLLRGCDAASCCVILLTHLPVSCSVSRATHTSHSVHCSQDSQYQPTASTLTRALVVTEQLGKNVWVWLIFDFLQRRMSVVVQFQ